MSKEVPDESISNEETIEEIKYRKKTVSLSQETPIALVNALEGKEDVNPIESRYEKIKDRLKSRNDNKNVTFNKFTEYYMEFIEDNEVTHSNVDLKEYLEDIFDLLSDNIDLKERNDRLSREGVASVVEGSLLAIISKITDKTFEEITKDFPDKAISESSLGKVTNTFNKVTALLNA